MSFRNMAASQRRLYLWIALATLGAACLLHILTASEAAGVLLFVGGVAGAAWEITRLLQQAKAEQQTRKQAEQHALQQEQRRVRRTTTRERRLRERARQSNARQQQAARQRQTREAEQQHRRENDGLRAARQESVAREAARLQSLADNELRQAVTAIFIQRGYEVQTVAGEAGAAGAGNEGRSGEWRLTRAENAQPDAAVCLPAAQPGTVDDVQQLESLRRDLGAARGYLVALAGFTPACARLVERLPITLVEAHLLAAWAAGETRNQMPALPRMN